MLKAVHRTGSPAGEVTLSIVDGEHHDAVLAEILLSRKVGLVHVHLVGRVIVARAELSLSMLNPPRLSFGQYADIVEEVLDLEDRYKAAWGHVKTSGRERDEHLAELRDALSAAADGINRITERLSTGNGRR